MIGRGGGDSDELSGSSHMTRERSTEAASRGDGLSRGEGPSGTSFCASASASLYETVYSEGNIPFSPDARFPIHQLSSTLEMSVMISLASSEISFPSVASYGYCATRSLEMSCESPSSAESASVSCAILSAEIECSTNVDSACMCSRSSILDGPDTASSDV